MSAAAVEEVAAPRTDRRHLWVMPLLVVGILAALWLWVHSRELDAMEQQALATDVVLTDLWQHVKLVVASTALTLLIGIPLGVLFTRRGFRGLGNAVLAIANIGQAVPSFGILVILAILFGVGFDKAVVALVVYALLPVLRNTMVGIQGVDAAVIDAGRGMGMTSLRRLFMVELPLAVPVILAGVRVALVLNVGVATLATFTNAGGLGSIISAGIALNRTTVLLVGCGLTVALALTVDWIAGLVEARIRPRGI